MLDFDAGKLLIIAVVALIVIGPKDLPRVLRQVGQAVARVKRMAAEFQGQFMDAMREADLEAIREDLKKATADAELDARFDPARDIQRELTLGDPLYRDTRVPPPGADLPSATPEPPAAPSALDGFVLPPAAPADEFATSVADAGAVPTADLEPEPDPAAGDAPAAAAAEPPSRKRRIRVKRRASQGRRVHRVLDRTGLARPAAGRMLVREAHP